MDALPVPPGKRIALIAGAVALVAVVGGVVTTLGRLREEWSIWQLSSEDEVTRFYAAEVLVTMQSVRAAPELIRWIKTPSRSSVLYYSITQDNKVVLDEWSYALFRLGVRALPALLEENKRGRSPLRI